MKVFFNHSSYLVILASFSSSSNTYLPSICVLAFFVLSLTTSLLFTVVTAVHVFFLCSLEYLLFRRGHIFSSIILFVMPSSFLYLLYFIVSHVVVFLVVKAIYLSNLIFTPCCKQGQYIWISKL